MEEWGSDEGFNMEIFSPAEKPKSGAFFRSNALSGGERHRLFLRRHDNFKDLSLISGVDFREDGRGFVLFDYDLDGSLDMGITSPNYPRFRIVKNRLAELLEKPNGFVEVKLVGGQTSTEPSSQWSPREPYGARVLVTTGDRQRMFQLNCGEGLSIQNAKRIHIGMGQTPKIDKLTIVWPSGKTTVQENVPAGERLTIFENPDAQAISKK
jgi:hypothetical protein